MSTALERRTSWDGYLTKLAPRLQEVATAHLQPERIVRVVQAAMARTPKLAECTKESMAVSLLLASQLGLEPASPLGHLYLVPYGRECTPLIGKNGMLELIRRTGEVRRVNCGVFYRQEVEDGTFVANNEPPSITHQWTGEQYQDDDLAGSYCLVETNDGQTYMEICSRAEIDKRRSRSKAGRSGPWVTDFAAMAQKSAIRKLFGSGKVPVSAEHMAQVSTAMESDADSMKPGPRYTRAARGLAGFDHLVAEPEPEPVAIDDLEPAGGDDA